MREVELQDVAEIIAGQSPKSEFYNETGEGAPFFQGKADFGDDYPTITTWCTKPKKMAKEGDILFSVRAPVGPTNIAKVDCCIGRGLSAVRPGDEILRSYLRYFFKKIEQKISDHGRGSTFKAITQKDLKTLKIPLPSLSEQKAIVAKLDRAQRLIDIDREMLAKYDELIQSVFLEMFGMDFEKTDTTIGDICDVKGGKRLPKGSSFSDTVTEHPYLRVVDFIPNGIDESQIKYISADLHDKISRYTINVDNLFISIAGTIGIAGLIPDNLDGANLTENAAKLIIKNKDEIRKKYLSYLINSKLTQSFIEMRTMAVGVPKLALFRIKEIPVYIPPVEHQERFEEVVDRIEIEKKIINQSLNKSEKLFSSLVQGVFN